MVFEDVKDRVYFRIRNRVNNTLDDRVYAHVSISTDADVDEYTSMRVHDNLNISINAANIFGNINGI